MTFRASYAPVPARNSCIILVNISAVGTSTTLTLQPVSFSQSGPENCVGSSDRRPASHTMVMVLPWQIFLAASTAFCAALCALAAPAQARAEAATSDTSKGLSRASRRRPRDWSFILRPPMIYKFLICSLVGGQRCWCEPIMLKGAVECQAESPDGCHCRTAPIACHLMNPA